jgi:hypothetical protein
MCRATKLQTQDALLNEWPKHVGGQRVLSYSYVHLLVLISYLLAQCKLSDYLKNNKTCSDFVYNFCLRHFSFSEEMKNV